MTSQECLGGKMNQIWFGLLWINPKESKTQRKKQRNKKRGEKKKCFPD